MKKIVCMISATSLLVACIFGASKTMLYAADFAGNEEAWLQRCSVPQKTTAAAQECAAFKSYYAGIQSDLKNEASTLESQIAGIKGNIDAIQEAINKQNELIEKIEKQIALNDASIRLIETEIEKLTIEIDAKVADIEKRNALITERMVKEQASVGTNINIEIIMGAKDLIDLIRKVDGLQKITESDQNDIKKLLEEKALLDLQKQEQDRLKQTQEDQKKENEASKQEAEDVKAQKDALLGEYLAQEADLNQKMRSVKADIGALANNIININTSVEGSYDFSGNGSFIRPLSGPSSAGTWYYPSSFGGGVHLGWDVASSVGTPIYAPADGIILYANNPVATNNGFLNNWVGWPLGGGNTIQMLTQVDGVTYAISFFHMARENFLVRAGQQVSKGQQIGASGNSGNVSGPHCHIEVVNLGSMSVNRAIASFQSTADFAWGTGWGTAALSRVCSVSGPPCRERPELIFG